MPEGILTRMLSLKAYVTPATLPACQSTGGGDRLSREELGKGRCGTVYTIPPSPVLPGPLEVGKIPNSPKKIGELLNDFEMHRRAAAALSRSQRCQNPRVSSHGRARPEAPPAR